MARIQFSPDDPRAWLDRAKSNLVRAEHRVPNVYLEDLCFDAHQAAEKALKAVCIYHGIEFPYVHDLAQLITCLETQGITVPPDVRQAARLTRYAVAARYPGLADPVGENEHKQAVEIATCVVEWASTVLAF